MSAINFNTNSVTCQRRAKLLYTARTSDYSSFVFYLFYYLMCFTVGVTLLFS